MQILAIFVLLNQNDWKLNTTMFTTERITEITEQLKDWSIHTIPTLLLLALLFYVLLKVFSFSLNKFKTRIMKRIDDDDDRLVEGEKRVETLFGLLNGVLKTAFWIMFLMICLREIGIDIGPLLASAGVLGLALSFGAQELVRDGISGFFLLLEDRVRVGDVAVVNGTGGLVESIDLRTITLRDLAGVVHTFQNGKINTLSNMTKDWSAMVFDIGVDYKEDVDKVIACVKEVGHKLQADPDFSGKIIEPIEIFGLDKFGESDVVIKARIKTLTLEQWAVGREFNKRLKIAFDEQGIDIPFPHRTIYWGQGSSAVKLKQSN